MYAFDSRIRYSEVDAEGRLTWLALMDYFQDCSVFHSESLELGISYLAKKHLAWVLSSWQICINRMPKIADLVTTRTWPYKMKGFYGYRNFVMDDEHGKRLAYANSIWVLMDTQLGRPVRVPQDIGDIYGMEPQLPMECSDRKINIPEQYTTCPSMTVPKYFIDTNHHMNNSCYVQVAQECLPADFSFDEVRVEYRKAAVQGNVLVPKLTVEENRVTVVLAGEEKTVYAVIVFERKEKLQ